MSLEKLESKDDKDNEHNKEADNKGEDSYGDSIKRWVFF